MSSSPSTKTLLIVCNTPSPNTGRLAEAVTAGARHDDIENVDVYQLEPLDANADAVMNADGVILGTTENFGYMSGLMKDFLERIYYPCLEHTEGKPWCLYVRAGNDGTGAKSSVERIVTGLAWRAVRPALVMSGEWQDSFEDEARELGQLMAAGLEAGVF